MKAGTWHGKAGTWHGKAWTKHGKAWTWEVNGSAIVFRASVPGGTCNNFGLFLDASPDYRGKVLMRRSEAAIARTEGRKERTLFESPQAHSPLYATG
jgi:serine/threonine-protein kinase HipA